MGDMIKVNKIGNPEDAFPWHRLAGPVIAIFFDDLRVVRNNIFVAVKTFFKGGQTCIGGPFCAGMTETTVYIFHARMNAVAEGCDALVIATEWPEFKKLDLERVRRDLTHPILFDGRNLFDPVEMEKLGFIYKSVGR